VKSNEKRRSVGPEIRNAIRAALCSVFPGHPIVRCIVRGSRRGWLGFAIILPSGQVTVAVSPELLEECWAPDWAEEFLRKAGLVRTLRPTSNVFVLRHKRQAIWLWFRRIFQPKPAPAGGLAKPIARNVATP
jgi:hypothetical protein